MSTLVVLAVIVVILALAFDFINGFHDTANAIATVVATRALSPRQAIGMAAVLNIVGALSGTGVAVAIAKGIVNPELVTLDVLIGGLVGAIIWNLFTWYFGVPSSSSHALVGGVAGSAVAAAGIKAINITGFRSIVYAFLLSPFAGLLLGLLLMGLLTWLLVRLNASTSGTSRVFSKLQIVSAALMAFSHGRNDAQKAMGIITIALFSAKMIDKLVVPTWAIVGAAVAMGLGTSIGGWRIIRTLGHKMVKLHPVQGFAAETAASIIIETASAYHLPVSTTHVISSTILAVGTAKGVRAVNWGVAKTILWAMLLTIPASALVGAVAYWAAHALIAAF